VSCFDDSDPIREIASMCCPPLPSVAAPRGKWPGACSRPDRLGQGRRSQDRGIHGNVISCQLYAVDIFSFRGGTCAVVEFSMHSRAGWRQPDGR
jgi:hypothetical protein